MRAIFIVAMCTLLYSCKDKVVTNSVTNAEVYPLEMEQIEKLKDYAGNIKKIGKEVISETKFLDSISKREYSIISSTQLYSFQVYTDENDKPIAFEKAKTMSLQRPPVVVTTSNTCTGGSCLKSPTGGDCDGSKPCRQESFGCYDNCDVDGGCNQWNSCRQSMSGFSTGIIRL